MAQYRLISIGCFCHDNEEKTYWEHEKCEEIAFINTEAQIICRKCHIHFNFEDLLFIHRNNKHYFRYKPYDGEKPESVWKNFYLFENPFYFDNDANIDLVLDFKRKIEFNLERRIGPQPPTPIQSLNIPK